MRCPTQFDTLALRGGNSQAVQQQSTVAATINSGSNSHKSSARVGSSSSSSRTTSRGCRRHMQAAKRHVVVPNPQPLTLCVMQLETAN
jgi:hypothetical protein